MSEHLPPRQKFFTSFASGIISVQYILRHPDFNEILKDFVGQQILEMIEITFSLLWLSVLSLSLELCWDFAA